MSSISMEWLGGPIVLNLKEDDIMVDLADGYLPAEPHGPAITDGPPNPDGPASLNPPVSLETPEGLETPAKPDRPENSCADSAIEAA